MRRGQTAGLYIIGGGGGGVGEERAGEGSRQATATWGKLSGSKRGYVRGI